MSPVVVVGSVNVDYVIQISHLPQPGETVAGGTLAIRSGGKGANQAHAAARLGAAVTFIGAVGADDVGANERAALEAAGINTSRMLRCDGPTGVAVVLVDETGENMIAVAPGANGLLTSADVTARLTSLLDSDCVVLVSLEVPLPAIAAAAAAARLAGAAVIINPAPGMPLPPDMLAGAILTPNEGEIRLVAPWAESEDGAIAAVLAAGARAVVVTRGARGASLYHADGAVLTSPAPRVAVVDTVGAGDAFNGAMAVALSQGDSLEASLRRAIAAGAVACTGPGARGALPTAADIEALLAAEPT